MSSCRVNPLVIVVDCHCLIDNLAQTVRIDIGNTRLVGSYEARATSILDYQRLTKFRVRFYWLHRFGRDVDQPEYFRLDRCRVAELIECLCSFDGWLDGDATEGCQIFE